MARQKPDGSAPTPKPPIVKQVSAGGVVFRPGVSEPEVVLILVKGASGNRWQLPKGLIDPGESPEVAAIREVREEAGVDAELITAIDTIEYWYVGNADGQRVRFHKFVHLFLLRYVSGDVGNHDREVLEARWLPITAAIAQLAFKSEKQLVERSQPLISRALI